MPCGDIIVAQRQRPVQQRAELQLPVAVDAGIGRPPGHIFADEVVYHAALELLRLIKYIKPHPQPRGRLPGVLRVTGRAAPTILAAVQLQHRAVTVVALLHQ